jgi:hypothetical protein
MCCGYKSPLPMSHLSIKESMTHDTSIQPPIAQIIPPGKEKLKKFKKIKVLTNGAALVHL